VRLFANVPCLLDLSERKFRKGGWDVGRCTEVRVRKLGDCLGAV